MTDNSFLFFAKKGTLKEKKKEDEIDLSCPEWQKVTTILDIFPSRNTRQKFIQEFQGPLEKCF